MQREKELNWTSLKERSHKDKSQEERAEAIVKMKKIAMNWEGEEGDALCKCMDQLEQNEKDGRRVVAFDQVEIGQPTFSVPMA